jgi:hypothetical protein
VESEEQVEILVQAAQRVIGDFTNPHTGLLFAMPLSHVVGLQKVAPPPKGRR